MTSTDRINEALRLAKQGNFHAAQNILHLVEMGRRIPTDQMERAWAKFGKYWRGEG